MTLTKYDESIENYYEAISLSQSQLDRIDSVSATMSAIMLTEHPDSEIYAQGSFSTDTLVKPLTSTQSDGNPGEFDVDIVVEREWDGARSSLEDTASTLKKAGKNPDESKQKCVRVDYADEPSGVRFHVDIVPTRLKSGSGGREVPNRETDAWDASDAKYFADWFNSRCNEQPKLRKIAVILKRLRDLNGQTDNLKSITVLTLAEKYYSDNDSLMTDLLATLDGIDQHVSTTDWKLANPINTSEDLSVTVDDKESLKRYASSIVSQIEDAVSEDDGGALEDIFKTGFTAPASTQAKSAATVVPLAATPRAYADDGKQ